MTANNEAQHEGSDTAVGARPAWSFRTASLGMVEAYEVAVPAQDGVGGDDQVQLPQCGSGESVQEGDEECPVGWGESGFIDLALHHGELVAQRQDLDVLVGAAHR